MKRVRRSWEGGYGAEDLDDKNCSRTYIDGWSFAWDNDDFYADD